jgi:hypothetical protein
MKKILAISVAICLVMALALPLGALAVNDDGSPVYIDSITFPFSEIPELEITLTHVYRYYQSMAELSKFMPDSLGYAFILAPNGTVTFSRDVVMFYDGIKSETVNRLFSAGVAYSADEVNGCVLYFGERFGAYVKFDIDSYADFTYAKQDILFRLVPATAVYLDSVTFSLPERRELEITLTHVYPYYQFFESEFPIEDETGSYEFFLAPDSTVTFSEDTALIIYSFDFLELTHVEKTFSAGVAYSADEINGGLLYFHDISGNYARFDISTNIDLYYATQDIMSLAVPTTGASDWAVPELKAVLTIDVIPAAFIENWQAPTDRLHAAEAIVKIIEVFADKTAAQIAEEKGWILDAQPFSDTADRNVAFLKAAGITNGMGDGLFGAEEIVTRAQMITMIGRGAEIIRGIAITGTHDFTDVPDWADAYVGFAVANGITNGVGGGLFDPGGTLTNEQTGVFEYRAYKAWK